MKIADESINVAGSVERAWAKLIEWEKWPTWDTGMASISFPGALALGARGDLKLKDGPKVMLKVTEFTPLESYTSEFELLGARLVFGHFLVPDKNANTVRLRVTVDAVGLMAPLLGNISKPNLVKSLPVWMANFKDQLENTSTAKA